MSARLTANCEPALEIESITRELCHDIPPNSRRPLDIMFPAAFPQTQISIIITAFPKLNFFLTSNRIGPTMISAVRPVSVRVAISPIAARPIVARRVVVVRAEPVRSLRLPGFVVLSSPDRFRVDLDCVACVSCCMHYICSALSLFTQLLCRLTVVSRFDL